MHDRRRALPASVSLAAGLLALACVGFTNAPPPRGEAADAGLPNFHQVATNLYRGAQPDAMGFETLAGLGVRTVINLRSEHPDTYPEGTPLHAVYIPMLADQPQVEDVRTFLRVAADPTNQPCFVHCRRGADRTGFMVASYRIVVEGWEKERAIKEMTSGGFGYFPGYRDIVRTLRALDVPALRAELKIPPAPP